MQTTTATRNPAKSVIERRCRSLEALEALGTLELLEPLEGGLAAGRSLKGNGGSTLSIIRHRRPILADYFTSTPTLKNRSLAFVGECQEEGTSEGVP